MSHDKLSCSTKFMFEFKGYKMGDFCGHSFFFYKTPRTVEIYNLRAPDFSRRKSMRFTSIHALRNMTLCELGLFTRYFASISNVDVQLSSRSHLSMKPTAVSPYILSGFCSVQLTFHVERISFTSLFCIVLATITILTVINDLNDSMIYQTI